jgi:class 3 adenylate cyclase
MTQLAELDIFRDVNREHLQLLSEDMVRFFRDGDPILREDEGGGELLVVLEGEANVFREGIFLVCRKAGDIIGEQAVLEGSVRSATVVARGMVRTLLIPHHIVKKLIADAAFVRNIAKSLSTKLRAATSMRAVRFRNEERLFGEFSAHVSPELASRLLAQGASYGTPRFEDVVLLMSDVRSFTELSGRMAPHEIGEQISAYLDRMVEILYRHGAFVDKYIGDAILAVWGLTPHDGNLGARAVACAEEMLVASAGMSFGGQAIRIGIGLTSGNVFAGNVGGERKRQFTVLGSAVNLASRLESETKRLERDLVISSELFRDLPASRQEEFEKYEERAIKGFGVQTIFARSARPVGTDKIPVLGKDGLK